jgi:ubiquitin-protein ligase
MSEPHFIVSDPVYQGFMDRQLAEGMALSDASDILDLRATPMAPPHYIATFHCTGLVRGETGEIREANEFSAGVWFPDDYLRRANPFEMIRMFTPRVWHPNVSDELPLICIGDLTPGTPLVDILFRLYEVLSYQRWHPVEHNSLNKRACAWAREHQQSFPTDRRPLKRRCLNLEVRAK